MKNTRRRSGARPTAGAVLVIVAVVVVLLFFFGAMAVDASHMWEVSSQCQATADAAALAAGRQLPDQVAAKREAMAYGLKNMDVTTHGTVVAGTGVEFGTWNFSTKVFTPTSVVTSVNAVRVKASRSTANSNPLALTLAKAMGFQTADVSSRAIAAFAAKKPWDLALLQDVTSSFSAELSLAKQADHNLLDCFTAGAPPQSLFGIVTFTGWSKIISPLTVIGSGYSPLNTGINNIKTCGTSGAPVCSGTDIAAGLQAAVNMLTASTSGFAKAIVLVSDGQPEPNSSGSHPSSTAAQLKTLATQWADNANAAGISIFVVFYDGDNDAVAKAFMQTLIRGEGIFLTTPDPAKIPSLLSSLCGQLIGLKLVD